MLVKLYFKSFILFCFCSLTGFSQNKSENQLIKKDSIKSNIDKEKFIATIKNSFNKRELNKLDSLFSLNYDRFSEDISTNWIYAFYLSEINEVKEANSIFKKLIVLDPNNDDAKKDYARFLYKNGKINKAETIINNFSNKNSNEVEFLLMLANINFWKGKIDASKNNINQIKSIYPKTDITKELENKIFELTRSYIDLNFEYESDSQPMDFIGSHLNVREYVNRFLNLKLEISKYDFNPLESGALIIKLHNQFYFSKVKLTANLNAGMYINELDKSDWVGGINFTKKLFKDASINFGYSKNRLISTLVSTTFNLTQQNYFGSLDYENKFVILNLGYNYKFFEDNNNIQSIASWLISQPFKFQNFQFQFGYGYSYTDSKDILFFYDEEGLGIYNPYFTPKDQQIHSGLFIANYKITKNLRLEGKVNYGIKAEVNNPYSIEINPGEFIIGGFYKADFNYSEIIGAIHYDVSNNFQINTSYIFQETFFYDRNNINLGLKFKF